MGYGHLWRYFLTISLLISVFYTCHVTGQAEDMGRCDGHQHTHLCHLMGVLLCLLFHVHIHACHQGDLQSLPDDHNHSQALYSNGTDPGLRDNALYNNTVAGATLNRVFRNLFLKYGNGESLSFEAFEHMLENIGLADLHIHDHKVERHLVEGKFKEFHSHHNHTHGEEVWLTFWLLYPFI